MAFVSYAQNFEDVMLWRALGHVQRGFYIDIGAWSPDLDSVTRAFSERGWRGINVEPDPVWFPRLQERRPSDTNLQVVVGDSEGRATMHFIANSGLSTMDDAIARTHAAAGWPVEDREVTATTLTSIWRAHVPEGQPVHFLKVDVEGAERAVLLGNDWRTLRPWVVVVEATRPNSQVETHEGWESILLDAGYRYVYGDGLNRFYVAQERPELASAFRYPPNVFDGFLRWELQQQEKEVAEAKRLIDEMRRRIEVAEAGARLAREREQSIERLARRQAREFRRSLAARDAEIAAVDARIVEAKRATDGWEHQYRSLTASTAWRVTTPLRRIAAQLPPPVLRHMRRAAKAAWWAMTPWRLPARMEALRERRRAASAVEVEPAVLAECAPGTPAFALLTPNCFWPLQDPQAISDAESAARFCIDLCQTSGDLRARFPKALSAPTESGFARWLLDTEAPRLGLPSSAVEQLRSVLASDFAARARQYFLFRADVRKRFPLALTPAASADLLRWFVSAGRREGGLRIEEIVWLFLQAQEDPARELARAYRFTPGWQELHPDGMTVFGAPAFADWLVATYKLHAGDAWIDPATWPLEADAARQLREAYHARVEWRMARHDALATPDAAKGLVEWLQSPASPLAGDAAAWCRSLDAAAIASELAVPGLNVIGHFCSPSGLRVSAEALVEGLRMQGLPTSLRDIRTDIKDEPFHERFDGLEDFEVTLIHTQPEPFFRDAFRRADLAERSPRTYRIAYWYWEFDSIPDKWLHYASMVDEVWTATEFVAKGLREKLPVPVKTLFPGVQLGKFQRRDRAFFGIPEHSFAFLFNFHMNSVMERKNPLGLIRAFKAAFKPGEPVVLVIKTMFGSHQPLHMKQLRDAAVGSNVILIDETYDADEVLSLMDACDAYVSLHRSEGLGLTMAEAMLLGKPVIATHYSGNVDFMDESNCLPVPYELVKLGRPYPPYDENLVWAEPSLEHAARLMRRVFDNPEWARELGARARTIAQERLSIRTASDAVARRLVEIHAELKAGRRL